MESLETVADKLKLLGDKTRLHILSLLKEDPCCVCEIVAVLGMSQPSVSQHLRKLKDAGLILENRRGQWVFYSLNVEDKPYIADVLNHIPSGKEQLEELAAKGLRIECK